MTATAALNSGRLPLPPQLSGLPVFGNLIDFAKAGGIPLEFLQRSFKQHGDIFRLKVGGKKMVVVANPALFHEILVKRVNEFHKPIVLSPDKPHSLERFLGSAILTGDHAEWRPQRKLIQPLMHTKHIEGYAETMTRFGERLLATWKNGETRNIHHDMVQVTMWIIGETMFGADVDATADLELAGSQGQEIALSDLLVPLPEWLLGRRNRRAEVVNRIMSDLVARFVAERNRTGHGDRRDLLSLLMQTTDEDGNPVSEQFVRDNILTLFFAGHETTANTLTWALHFLDQHPEVAARLHAEVDSVLGGRVPTLEDLKHLPYTMMVIKETMRAEPTVASLPRVPTEDTELGGFRLNHHEMILMPIHLVHNDPRYWDAPERFDPERFSAENEPNIHKFAYLPFGGGPRICIGNHFSLMESQLLLAMIASRFNLTHAPGRDVTPVRQITTSPKNGLWMQVARR